MNKTCNVVWIMAVLLSCCVTAKAGIVNGAFETGDLSGWAATGLVVAVGDELSRDFLGLDQPPAGGLWLPSQGSYFASLWSTDSGGTDAAILSQTFLGTIGETLRFDYFFDFGDVGPLHDTAIATLLHPDGSAILFEHNTAGHELGDDENVGWATASYTLPRSGLYTLEYRVTDAVGSFESILGIDNVTVGAVIPAPGAILLGTLGAGLVGWMPRRRTL